jgi:hypothetical protein
MALVAFSEPLQSLRLPNVDPQNRSGTENSLDQKSELLMTPPVSNFTYETSSGVTVSIPSLIAPCQVFGVTPRTTWRVIKSIFARRVADESRADHGIATLAYEMMRVVHHLDLQPSHFQRVAPASVTCGVTDPVVMIYLGHCKALTRAIETDRSILSRSAERNCPLIYLAARSGHNDIVQLLFRYGVDVNATGNTSSPLYPAAFYGHAPVVKQLMARGASVTLKNGFGNLPIDEASSEAIKELISHANDDDLAKLLRRLKDHRLSGPMETIGHDDNIVGYRVLQNLENRSEITTKWKLG